MMCWCLFYRQSILITFLNIYENKTLAVGRPSYYLKFVSIIKQTSTERGKFIDSVLNQFKIE